MALASLDTVRSAGLIQRIITPRITMNEYSTLWPWMEQMPEEVLRLEDGLGRAVAVVNSQLSVQ